MHYDYERIKSDLDSLGETGNFAVETDYLLGEDDSAWNPASTKNRIWGPCALTYKRFPDGGIEVTMGLRN